MYVMHRAVASLSYLGGQDEKISSIFPCFSVGSPHFFFFCHFLPHFGLSGGLVTQPERHLAMPLMHSSETGNNPQVSFERGQLVGEGLKNCFEIFVSYVPLYAFLFSPCNFWLFSNIGWVQILHNKKAFGNVFYNSLERFLTLFKHIPQTLCFSFSLANPKP